MLLSSLAQVGGNTEVKLRMATQIRRLSSALPRWPPPGNQPASPHAPRPHQPCLEQGGNGMEGVGWGGGSSSNRSHLMERNPQEGQPSTL